MTDYSKMKVYPEDITDAVRKFWELNDLFEELLFVLSGSDSLTAELQDKVGEILNKKS